MRALGIKKADPIVIYDMQHLAPATRVYWMLKTYGAENVSVLDGGFQRWIDDGLEVAEGDSPDAWAKEDTNQNDADYDYKLNENMVVRYE